jgi:hypothetical protein
MIVLEWARNVTWMTKQERHTGFWWENMQKKKQSEISGTKCKSNT